MQHENRNGSSIIAQEQEDLFRYGYRFVKKRLANGKVVEVEEPLTLEDVFFPQEGDQLVSRTFHGNAIRRIMEGLVAANGRDSRFRLTTDTNTMFRFKIKKVKPVRSDVLALKGVKFYDDNLGTIVIDDTGAETILAVEVTSPETRKNDLTGKVDYYLKGGVDIYLIVDYGPHGGGPPQLIGRRRVKGKWKAMKPNADGFLDLDPFNLLIGTDDQEICMYCRDTGEFVSDVDELVEERREAKRQADDAKQQADKAKQQADDAKEVARTEREQRMSAEQQVKELKALLQKAGIKPPTK